MALKIKKVPRTIHYYELNLKFLKAFKPTDGDQFRELFSIITSLAKTKAKIRYQDFGEWSIFIQDVKFVPLKKHVIGKLRHIRKNLLPEIMNTVTDEARGIEAKAEEGLLETTHFVIDFSSKKKKLAIEYNQFGAKIADFILYLENIGRNKGAVETVGFVPLVRNDLKGMKRRINRCSEFIVKVDKENLTEIKTIDKGLYSMMEASIAHFKSDQATIRLKFDYRKRTNTNTVSKLVDKLIDSLIADRTKVEYFNTLEVKAEDSERNNMLTAFDLLIDKVKDELLVEKKERYRTIISDDILTQMQERIRLIK